jgi:hypothetical protein
MRDALDNFLALVDLGYLVLQQLVALLAELEDLGALGAQLLDILEDLLRDLGGGLVLSESGPKSVAVSVAVHAERAHVSGLARL